SSGWPKIWVRRSGEAPSKNQAEPSGEKAICACPRGRARSVPARRPLQLRQEQFHCGRPPPAAEPRTLIRMEVLVDGWGGRWVSTSRSGQVETSGRDLQFSVGVRADFTVESDLFVLRCDPFHRHGSLNSQAG